MNIKEFEQIEEMKKHFREQLKAEIKEKVEFLKFNSNDELRNPATHSSEDFGYNRAILQLKDILNKL